MADSRLRLAIVTELDNAGIKATKEQIDGLEKSVMNLGNSGANSTSKLESALGNLPGALGKVGKAMGGAVGAATALAGAWTIGWEIGTKINEFLTNELGWFNFGAEAAKQNQEYAKSLKEVDEAAQKLYDTEIKRHEQLEKNTEKAVKEIDRQTRAYAAHYQTITKMQAASDDADKLSYEIAKYDAMRAYRLQGNDEAAEQVGKYYDIIEAERQAQKELRAFDDETNKYYLRVESAESKLDKRMKVKEEHYQAMIQAEREAEKWRKAGAGVDAGGEYDESQ